MRTSLCWLLAVSLVFPAWRSDACEVIQPPPPLGAQIQGAQAIVVARLVGYSTESFVWDDAEPPLHVRLQHMRVLRLLKGSVPEYFHVGPGELMAEAHGFIPEQDARPRILFVLAQEEPSEAAVPRLSVEELMLDDVEDLAVFIDRISEAQQLREKGASKAEEREWLVRCAMRRATRGHAVQALVSQSGPVPVGEEPELTHELTLAQRRAILDGFRQEPTTDGSFVAVLALARGVSHPAFDRVAVGVMEALLREPGDALRSDTSHALRLLMERLGVEDADARWSAATREAAEPRDEEDFERFWAEAVERRRALWEALRAEGRLVPAPRVPPARSAVDRSSLFLD